LQGEPKGEAHGHRLILFYNIHLLLKTQRLFKIHQ
jgi:hypothetical protein